MTMNVVLALAAWGLVSIILLCILGILGLRYERAKRKRFDAMWDAWRDEQ
jgi:hypothetical protein